MLEILIGALALVAGDAVEQSSFEAPIAVSGPCTCPTPADVSARLASVGSRHVTDSPPPRAKPERHEAVLTCPAKGTVDVVLRRADGERIADRALDAQESCSDLASAIAVIIGAWEADLDPGVSPAVELHAPAVAAPVTLPAPPSPSASPPRVTFTADSERRAASPPGPAAPPRALRFSLGIGLLAAVTDDGQVAPGATVQGDVFPSSGHLGVAAAVTATTSRSSSVGSLPDVAHWSRVTLGLGPEVRFNLGATRIDLQAEGIAAVLTVGGAGLPATSSESNLQLGGALALRGAWAWGTSAFWAGAQMLVFPGNDQLVVGGVSAQGRLPHIELQLASGLSLGRFR